MQCNLSLIGSVVQYGRMPIDADAILHQHFSGTSTTAARPELKQDGIYSFKLYHVTAGTP